MTQDRRKREERSTEQVDWSEADDTASHSQAVPSELASLKKYSIDCDGLPFFDEHGVWYSAEDVQSLFSHSAATGKSRKTTISPEMKAALDKAAETGALVAETPDGIAFINRGHDYGDNAHLECTACGGSGHIEDQQVRAASPAAPLAGKASDVVREAIEAAFEEREGWRVKIAAAVRALAAHLAEQAEPVAWAVVSPKGGIHKLAIKRDSAERKLAAWLEEWPNNTPSIRPLIYGDAPLAGKAEDDTRNAFEAWYMENFTSNRVYLTRMAGGERKGEYFDSDTQNIWLAWQAGAGRTASLAAAGASVPSAVPAEEALVEPDNLPRWIDNLKGLDPTIDALIEYIIKQRTPAEPAPILASALTAWNLSDLRDLMCATPDGPFYDAKEVDKLLARLSKPTAQGTAQSIDTQEFRELMCHLGYWVDEDDAWNDECGAALVEFINRHIAAQAPAGRDAIRDEVLEEAAERLEALNESSGDAAAYDQRDMNMLEMEREQAVADCATAIRALKSHAAEQSSGSAK